MPKRSWREFDAPLTPNKSKPELVVDKAEWNVRVQRTKGGKGGKTVTVVSGLALDVREAKFLLKRFKAHCGAGGTLKGQTFELQGDQVAVLIKLLKEEGYSPKQSGG